MVFNPNEHLMQLKRGNASQEYLEVKWRIVWFREECPKGTIETEEILVDLDRECSAEVSVYNAEKRRSERVIKTAKGIARYKAVVTDGKGGRATAHGSESAVDFGDFIEKAETKSIGRALALLGYGTQFTGDELAERHRIVDSPVDSPSQDESAPTDGNTPSPSEIDRLRSRFSAAYHVKDEDFEARWTRYKVYLLQKDVADPNLDQVQRACINGDLVKEERRIATTNKQAKAS